MRAARRVRDDDDLPLRPSQGAGGRRVDAAGARQGRHQAHPEGFPTSSYFSEYAGKPAYTKKNNVGLATHGWQADWNDGFGFLSQIVDSRTIRESGNYNLSIKSPEIDALIDQASAETDVAKREAIWGEIDRKVMENAYVLPAVWAKALTIRGQGLTNVYVTGAFDMYDFPALGVE